MQVHGRRHQAVGSHEGPDPGGESGLGVLASLDRHRAVDVEVEPVERSVGEGCAEAVEQLVFQRVVRLGQDLPTRQRGRL